MNSRIEVSVPAVAEVQALQMMIHHLTLAAAYFEAVPEDHKLNIEFMGQVIKDGREPAVTFLPAMLASIAFYESLRAQYDALAGDEASKDWLEGKQC